MDLRKEMCMAVGEAIGHQLDKSLTLLMCCGMGLESVKKIVVARWEALEKIAPAHILAAIKEQSADREAILDKILQEMAQERS